MKVTRTNHIDVVSERSPSEFQDKLNELYTNLRGTKFTQTLYNNENGFTAYITYEVVERLPECLKDEYELRGIEFTCSECPYYEPINNFEGQCDFCRGTLRKNDRADCKAFWAYMEEKEEEKELFEELRTEIKVQYGTIRKFSEEVKIDNAYLSRMLNGKTAFSISTRFKILKALGIEICEENLNKYFKENTK